MYFLLVSYFLCHSEFCPGVWIKSCRLVNYCTIRAIVKIKMVRKVVFGTFRPIVNISVLVLVLVLVLRNCAVTVSSTGAKKQIQGDDNGHVGRPC